MHPESYMFFTINNALTYGVHIPPSHNVPFEIFEPGVVLRVNDGEFALCEGDSAEGVAIAQPAVEKQKALGRADNPGRQVYTEA